MKRFTELNLDEVPVVASDDSFRLLGMLRRKDVIARYNQLIADYRRQAQDESVF
jgi:hypothetical protein